MRDVLFRGKRLDNGKWIEGYYFKHHNRQPCAVGDMGRPEDWDDLICISGFADWNMPKPMCAVKVDPETLGEFTGLYDKNGERIFEGDIIRHYYDYENPYLYETDIVVWDGSYCKFERKEASLHSSCTYEIVGNIYDNSEEMKTD